MIDVLRHTHQEAHQEKEPPKTRAIADVGTGRFDGLASMLVDSQ